MTINAYELRWNMWRSADAFLQRSYEHQMEAYKAGHIPEKPEFPSIRQVNACAMQMREFVDHKGNADD